MTNHLTPRYEMTKQQLLDELTVERFGPLPTRTHRASPDAIDVFERLRMRELQRKRRERLAEAIGEGEDT